MGEYVAFALPEEEDDIPQYDESEEVEIGYDEDETILQSNEPEDIAPEYYEDEAEYDNEDSVSNLIDEIENTGGCNVGFGSIALALLGAVSFIFMKRKE